MSDLTRVRHWADALISLHLDASWSFAFDHAKRRAGQCDFTRKRITLSRYLAARFDDDDVHQTLLHEVAHALAGPEAAHGPVWLKTARELGYVGGRTHIGETAVELAPWIGTCPAGHIAYRHRRPTRAASCVKCAPHYDPQHLFVWEKREITAADRRAALQER